jgi:hypothetical protein
MFRTQFAAAAAILTLGLTAANAQPAASVAGCLDLAGKVKSAIESGAQSPNVGAAQTEQRYGREFCTNGYYQNGMNHYSQALKLLGGSAESASGQSTSNQS